MDVSNDDDDSYIIFENIRGYLLSTYLGPETFHDLRSSDDETQAR